MEHKGKIVFAKDDNRIIECDTCGFKHINPIISESDLDEYYSKKYFKQIKSGKNADSIRRLMNNNDKANLEIEWLYKTLYNDINQIFLNYLPDNSRGLCEIGCGSGHFLEYMANNGWSCTGIEPSENTYCEHDPNLQIYRTTFSTFLKEHPELKSTYDAIVLANVLEHVPDPHQMIEEIKSMVTPEGVIYIRVPNDFSILQHDAQKVSGKDPWWVVLPDHINYFSMDSLENFLISHNLQILHKTTDFPMELFLLMGEDYVNIPEIGEKCHFKRRKLEMSLSDETRRSLYSAFAKMGIGRSCMFFVKLK
jgi:2-polyprenyl-3-methyl-5-hydroxy-6-metoxy-1,4-benzoquinol methylase